VSSKWFLSFNFPLELLYIFLTSPIHVTRALHPSWFDHS
jgi:hypothetical protein